MHPPPFVVARTFDRFQVRHPCHDTCLLPLDPSPLGSARLGGPLGRSFASSHAFPFPRFVHRFEVLLLCVGRRPQVLKDATKHLRGGRGLPRIGEAPPVFASVRFHSSWLPLCSCKGDHSNSLAFPSSPPPSSFCTSAPSFLLPPPALLHLLRFLLLLPSTTALACSVWSVMQPASVDVVVLSWSIWCGVSPPVGFWHPSANFTQGVGLHKPCAIEGTPVPLFLARSRGVPACVPVLGEDDRIMNGPFDQSCSSWCVSSFQSSDLALKLGSLPVTRRFRPFPSWGPLVFPFLLVR